MFGKKNINMKYTHNPRFWRFLKSPSLLISSFFWWDLKYQIYAWFCPRQRWLTNTIPNTWCDKVTLIPHLLFECLIHYVEKEEGLQDKIDWSEDLEKKYVTQEYVDNIKKTCGELREVYNYIKTERPQLEKLHCSSYPKRIAKNKEIFVKLEDGNYMMKSCEELYGVPYKEAYAEMFRIEKLLEEKNMWAMNTIVKYHQHLWT